jgi:hypothetical protein
MIPKNKDVRRLWASIKEKHVENKEGKGRLWRLVQQGGYV